jgi:hypothetical protein
VEVLSCAQDGLVEVRAKTTFLHTSAYSDGKRQVRMGVTQKRWVRKGEVLKVPFRHVWSHKRRVALGHARPDVNCYLENPKGGAQKT